MTLQLTHTECVLYHCKSETLLYKLEDFHHLYSQRRMALLNPLSCSFIQVAIEANELVKVIV